MKCLKVDEYIQRTASLKETNLLLQELEDKLKIPSGVQSRTVYDRVIRACNHQLGVGSPALDHINLLMRVVDICLCGYDAAGAWSTAQSSPLYMEKIIYHIVKKLSSLGVHSICRHLAQKLYCRLTPVQQVEDYGALVRSCFSVLWNGPSPVKDETKPCPRDKFHCKLQALAFLLLLDPETTSTPVYSKVPPYMENTLTEYESRCGTVTKEDGTFVVQTIRDVFFSSCSGGQGKEDNTNNNFMKLSILHVLSEVVFIVVEMLCRAGLYELANTLLDEIGEMVARHSDRQSTAVGIGKWAVNVCAAKDNGHKTEQAFTACARALRSLSSDLENEEAHAIFGGCSLMVRTAETVHSKGCSGHELLALLSFLEEYQEVVSKLLQRNFTSETEGNRLQNSLCSSLSQGFVFSYDSMLASQLEDSNTLDRVLLYCQASVGQMMSELRKQPNEKRHHVTAVKTVSNIACWLYNQKFYEQGFTLAEVLCKDLFRNPLPSLSIDTMSRPFMLAVQCSRRGGQLKRALDWIILWLKALGDNMVTNMTEPVNLWVKTKIDAFRNGDEDVRLRTLRDGFGHDVPEEGVMLGLLEEELRAYKEVAGDSAQERYNTLCDLLDICHEESPQMHLRAVYLCEMAQVVCFQDFSEQTDCTAIDFTKEALQLLDEVTETAENKDMLRDDKAHAFLWLYICTLEKNLQEAIAKDKKLQGLREQTKCVTTPIGTNDFHYEDKQKLQDSVHVYEALHINLAEEDKLLQPLEHALDMWSALLQRQTVPAVRSLKQTYNSIAVTAALFNLMGKPLKALEAYQCALGFSRHNGDSQGSANSLCQSAKILLEMGAPELALVQLGQAEKFISNSTSPEGPSTLSMLAVLLRARCCYSTGQVERGVSYLCEVLNEVNEQRKSKSWYLLRARALQTCSSYLSLDTNELPQVQRCRITQYGMNSPDTALYESLKLLCSLLASLVGKGLYGTHGVGSDMHFVHQGDDLVLKWQVLLELLQCSLKMVSVRSSSGAIHDARHQCLEALKLASKLQSLAICAELLVVKAELELTQGEREESGFDLDKVRNILELSTDFSNHEDKAEVKIKPRKGRAAQKVESPAATVEDEYKDILSTRNFFKEPVVRDQASSPPLKAQPNRWLASLAHESNCHCPCCSEPCLGRVTALWAATKADLALQLGGDEAKVGLKLHRASLQRCKSVAHKLALKLAKLFPLCGSTSPTLVQDVMGRVYLRMALSGLEVRNVKIHGIWNVLESGLTFVNSAPSPALRPLRAGLMATKAILCMIAMSTKRECHPEKLFSNVWCWNAQNEGIEFKSKHKVDVLPEIKKSKDTSGTDKKLQIPIKSKEAKKIRAIRPNIDIIGSTSNGKTAVPKTPMVGKTKQSAKKLDPFEFNTVVPTLAFTPVQKVKVSASAQRGKAKAPSKLQFHVYEELSPTQDMVRPVPGAPKRTKKSIFKVEFSDESDTEADSQVNLKGKVDVLQKRASTRRTTAKPKTRSEAPTENVPKRQTRGTRSTAVKSTSSEDETVYPTASARRGRTRGRPTEADMAEGPDTMRTIEETIDERLDISIEELRASDTEMGSSDAFNVDVEVLRRDGSLMRDDFTELRHTVEVTESTQIQHSQFDFRPEELTVNAVQSLLRASWLDLHHFPPPTLYPKLCSLFALTLGQQQPVTTAMLHAESLGVTSRHQTIRHLHSCLKKLRKTSNELADRMDALTLNDHSATETKSPAEQYLSKQESIFSFTSSDSSNFPKQHCQDFLHQLQNLPSGVTVCMMSLLGVKPGQMGDTIMLSRLDKGSGPVTVHISTSKQQHPVSRMIQEMDSIQAEQKVVNCVSDKAEWWEGRRALDSRVERLLEKMEALLGCWMSLLLPLSSDPEVRPLAKQLHKTLSAKGVMASEEMLRSVLSASPLLSQTELKMFAQGFHPHWTVECDHLFQRAISQLANLGPPNGHVVLILDKYLQKLPWESISILTSHSVSRMPSLHALTGLSHQNEMDPPSILQQGVDMRQVFYVLDPDANLEDSQDQFKEFFSSKHHWEGVCGVAPDSVQLEEAVATKDLYIYVGHGAGARFLDSQTMLKRQMKSAALLFGCSSAALAVRGDLEGRGIILNYLMAGCPFVLGNLWDVTDRDINRFTKALLESWISAGSGAPLLQFMGPSRQATHLKRLIGAAPIVYGLPIHLL